MAEPTSSLLGCDGVNGGVENFHGPTEVVLPPSERGLNLVLPLPKVSLDRRESKFDRIEIWGIRGKIMETAAAVPNLRSCFPTE